MLRRWRDASASQSLLLPPSLHDWLPEGRLANFVLDVVAQLNISAIESRIQAKDPWGERMYSPRMLVALLFYAWATWVFSSRRISRACVEKDASSGLGGASFDGPLALLPSLRYSPAATGA
jgi:hypothetical protein